jgi:hypothetical protein
MLFAAGYAAGRRGRRWWVGLSGLLAVAIVAVGVWGWSEHVGRNLVSSAVPEWPPHPAAPAAESSAEPANDASPDAYLHLRRQAERDPNTWLTSWQPAEPAGPAMVEPAIPRSGQRDLNEQ